MNLKRLMHGTGGAVLVAAGLLTGSLAFAQQPSGEITADQARAAALAAEPGTVLEVEREREGGKVIYEVEIRRDDGQVVEVTVDASTGAVLETEVEDDEDDADDSDAPDSEVDD
jgi:hypothetical protein